MTERIKIAEPVWSSTKAKQNSTATTVDAEQRTRTRKRYTRTNDTHEPSDCYNCAKGVNGFCIVAKTGQPRKTLEWCNANYEMCQYWERVK